MFITVLLAILSYVLLQLNISIGTNILATGGCYFFLVLFVLAAIAGEYKIEVEFITKKLKKRKKKRNKQLKQVKSINPLQTVSEGVFELESKIERLRQESVIQIDNPDKLVKIMDEVYLLEENLNALRGGELAKINKMEIFSAFHYLNQLNKEKQKVLSK